MNYKHFKLISLIVIFIATLLVREGYSFIKFNGAGGGYEEGGSIQEIGPQSIESYIIAGAAYYLGANSNIQSLLKMVELQTTVRIDYNTMQRKAECALLNMEKARETYEMLIQKAENTPYNPYVLDRLKSFDYDAFRQEYGLNSEWFEIVRQKLQPGDITGLFKSTYSDFKHIIVMLNEIYDSVSRDKLPALSLFWKLNETMTKSSTVGSYVARVFAEIR